MRAQSNHPPLASRCGEKWHTWHLPYYSGLGTRKMIPRLVTIMLLIVTCVEAQGAYHAFLAPLARKWQSHPELPNVRVGMGTVVILKDDLRSIRYSGEIWQLVDPGRLSYQLELHSGFVAEGGHWYRSGKKRVTVVFSGKIMTEMTVVTRQDGTKARGPANSCHSELPIAAARKIVCGSVILNQISLESLPNKLDNLPQ